MFKKNKKGGNKMAYQIQIKELEQSELAVAVATILAERKRQSTINTKKILLLLKEKGILCGQQEINDIIIAFAKKFGGITIKSFIKENLTFKLFNPAVLKTLTTLQAVKLYNLF